ncbi:MAG: ABC transporter substrate-binding protein [Hyphomicrobiaceae bacterium]
MIELGKETNLASQVLHNKKFRQKSRVVETVAVTRGPVWGQTVLLVLSSLCLIAFAMIVSKPVAAQDKSDIQTIKITYLRENQDKLSPISLLDQPTKDRGFAGAELGIKDNNTTGSFLGQKFELTKIENNDPAAIIAEAVQRADAGEGLIVADVAPDTLLKIADAVKDKDAVVFNAGAHDGRLRGSDCRANVKHTTPSYAMLADGLTQYMGWKKWTRWFLVSGPSPEDKLFADAIRASAKKFRMKIVEERTFTYDAGARRTDGGYDQIQQQIPKFTQKTPDYDVLVVADEAGLFGAYFPYRTWAARPVVGSVGLYPASWHPAIELWGGTQFQNRFRRDHNRPMTALDYDAWVAVRSIGEAATRTRKPDAKSLIEYMRSAEFEIAAFKGQKLTYRTWNGQLRQPIFIVTDKLHVTVSPQKEYLHRFSELDTLGIDKPQSKCAAFKK